ncbi:MAG: hypothetical protein GXO14_04400 [Thermococci archaeon]|nr:hypothetical protein [Thermococci archaeon]
MRASNVVAAFVMVAAIAATVALVYVNMPKLPTEEMVVNAVNGTASYAYTTTVTSQSLNQTSEGGFARSVYYMRWTTNGGPPVEWVLCNGSLYVNDSGGGFIKVNLSKRDLRRVLSSMSLADRIREMFKNSTVVYKGKHGNGFIIKIRYNRTIKAQYNLLTGSEIHVVGNITFVLDSSYRPTTINTTVLIRQSSSVSRMVTVTRVEYSNVRLPPWVLNAIRS